MRSTPVGSPIPLLMMLTLVVGSAAAGAQSAVPQAPPTAPEGNAAPAEQTLTIVPADADAAPTTPETASATATTTPPLNEPAVVDEWTIVSAINGRRLPDGRDTEEACGYARDVNVKRTVNAAEIVARATLTVPCERDVHGVLVPGRATLRLFPEDNAKANSALANAKAQGQKPVAKDKPQPVAATPPAKPKPCVDGQKPQTSKGGVASCVEVASDRGVPFLKGELSHLGDVKLTNPKTSFGVGIGAFVVDNVYYLQLRPEVNFYYNKLGIGLGAPVRFEMFDLNNINVTDPNSFNTIWAETGRFRTEDWDQIEDFLRPLRFATWGQKEDNLYIDVNRVHAITLGHGQLVRRYTGNIDIDEDNIFAEVDAYSDFGGVELMAGPFPLPRLAGGLVFVKPLGLFIDDTIAKSWSVGATFVTDLNAPTILDARRNPADGRTQLAVDASNQLRFADQGNVFGAMVQGAGIDTELKILKLDIIDLKVYGDYSHLFFPADSGGAFEAFNGGGAAIGGLARINFGKTPVRPIEDETDAVKKGLSPRDMKAAHAVRLRLELRTFGPQYIPSYFNTLYEVDRLQFGQLASAQQHRSQLPTKIAALALRKGEPWRAGMYAEASYAWVDVLALTIAYEDAYALGAARLPLAGRNLALHAESLGLGFLQLFATYHYRNFEQLPGIFSFNTDNEIFFFGGRLQVLPIMFLNASAQRAFKVGFSNDDTVAANAAGLRYSSVGLQNAWSGQFDVEFGWQF